MGMSHQDKFKKRDRIVATWATTLKNVPAFLIGNGPSLKDADLSCLKNHLTVGINRAFLLLDPTFLIWQDLALWMQHKDEIRQLEAIKYCRRSSDGKEGFYNFQMLGKDHRLTPTTSTLYGRGSSGPLAFQFAHALGCDPIVLIGMDCKNDDQGNTDFYGKNPMHRSHTLVNCNKGLRWMKTINHGRTIINCSPNKIFREQLSLEEALKVVGEPPLKGREKIKNKLFGINQ